VGLQLSEWSKEASCLLLSCEMDMRAGDEVPSFTVKSAKPLNGLISNARLKMQLDIVSETGILQLAKLVAPLHGGKSELVVKTRTADGKWAQILLGRRFQLDASMLEQVKSIEGAGNVELAPIGPVLALVR
jgi:DNA polymerase III subunit alpha